MMRTHFHRQWDFIKCKPHPQTCSLLFARRQRLKVELIEYSYCRNKMIMVLVIKWWWQQWRWRQMWLLRWKNIPFDKAWGISKGTICNKLSVIQIMADAAYATRVCHYMASPHFNDINVNDITNVKHHLLYSWNICAQNYVWNRCI